MKLKIEPSFILWLSVLFYLDGRVLLPFLAAAALHELGHYLALRRMGRSPTQITLRFSGAEMDAGALSYREELLAASAGPAASLLLGLLIPLCPALGLYSVILGCFNLLPVPGLDGGRMLRCLLLLRLPPETACRATRFAAILTALALWGGAVYLSGLDLGLWPLLLAALLLYKALSMEG